MRGKIGRSEVTGAIIEARISSTRLPGKILLPILGEPLIARLIERLRRAETLDTVIIATTTKPADDRVERFAGQAGVGCFRGSEEDVLGRVLGAAKAFSIDVIVEVTGDCPLIDPGVVDRVVRAYRSGGRDYASNVLRRTYPRGLDTQVFATALLEKVAGLTRDPVDREHVSLFIYEHPGMFSLTNVESDLPEKWQDLRLTVDTREDLELVTAIYEALYPEKPDFDLGDIIGLLERRGDLLGINQHIAQKKVR
jgi:spore coat polysaccharide biosynthesis protein SpsF